MGVWGGGGIIQGALRVCNNNRLVSLGYYTYQTLPARQTRVALFPGARPYGEPAGDITLLAPQHPKLISWLHQPSSANDPSKAQFTPCLEHNAVCNQGSFKKGTLYS